MIVRADAARLPVADGSIDVVVTSPPYNLGMPYLGVDDLRSKTDYRQLVFESCAEIARALVPGGRCFVNVPTEAQLEPNNPRAGRWSPSFLWHHALECAGLTYRMLIVWDQSGSRDAVTAWGSWLSPNLPNVKGRHEGILFFYKEPFARGRVSRGDCPTDQWLRVTGSVWSIMTTSRGDHPATFPAELVRRCLWLSTWPGDVVLDPFVGSGTTIYEGERMGRHVLGCDLSEAYCRRIEESGSQGSLFGAAPVETEAVS